jgi:hypothetical protein
MSSDAQNALKNGTLWGYGGLVYGSYMYKVSTYGGYWSSTVYSSNPCCAYYLYYYSSGLIVYFTNKYNGFQVRCVK